MASFFSSLRDRPDEITEQERRMAEVTHQFREVVKDLPAVLSAAEQIVERLKDIRQEMETDNLMEAVNGAQEEAQAPQEGARRA